MAGLTSELVISTYEKPRYLAVVLAALAQQRVQPTCVCVADDGSGAATVAVIADFADRHPHIALRHCHHADQGFRKNAILNRAIASSTCDYLLFIDDDCVMHPDFVARHLHLAHPSRFLSGSVIRVPQAATAQVLTEGAPQWDARGRLAGWKAQSRSEWLKSRPMPVGVMAVMDYLSPVRCNWAGGSASAYRAALMQVNGFDETMRYGGEDKELGVRLRNAGIRGRHVRYTAPLYHLDHGRGYVDPAAQRTNRAMIVAARQNGTVWTPDGIIKSEQPVQATARTKHMT